MRAAVLHQKLQSGICGKTARERAHVHAIHRFWLRFEKRFGVAPLTARDAAAPDVSGVLTLATPRTDDPLAGFTVPAAKSTPQLPAGPDHLEMALAKAAERLPVSENNAAGHQHVLPQVKSGKEAVAYARRRYRTYAGRAS